MTELPKAYNPKDTEARWYKFWRESGYFAGQTGAAGDPMCVVIPPPNVTGVLHMGHALNNTLQDVIIRRARMQGRPTLWMPGTDHAGIATQNVVEKRLAAEGLTRHDLGREAFVERVWKWKDEYETRILNQLEKLGCSCDWDRTRFTMDEGLSRAVRTVFVRLFDQGRIYRGNRIINWCPRCTTALSDIEVKHFDREGELVTLRYPLSDGRGHIDVATTRVETMLGDTAVAVHPKDDRYAALIGKTVDLPLAGRQIPIVADAAVEMEFGTGAVKVTPAHDANDFEIAQRHDLEFTNIFDKQARLNENTGDFRGLDRFEARTKIYEALNELGVVVDTQRPYVHSVGHCDRCDTIVEPWLSEQWFVAMAELVRPAIDAVESGRIRFTPVQPFVKTYLDWMNNIRDWCISRQLWWGHRIPVWYCANDHAFAALEDPVHCPDCQTTELTQDPDVLDTWFSSQLWPFSTFGWPDETEELRYWYPTNVLVTAYDILFLWVARMIVAGLHEMDEIPFHDVLFTGLVLDWQGKKMSKSLGNQVDPIDLIDQYGTDALRFTLVRAMTPGANMSLAEDWIEGDRRFVNKLWNATRFALNHLPDGLFMPEPKALADRWILSLLAATTQGVDRALENFEFAEAARLLHQFCWSQFCDWYLELAKLSLPNEQTSAVLGFTLETTLRLLHPIMPFVTEELWQKLPGSGESIMVSAWPASLEHLKDTDAEEQMQNIQDVIVEIRRFRHDHQIAPKRRIEAIFTGASEVLKENVGAVRALAGLAEVKFEREPPRGDWSQLSAPSATIYLPLTGVDLTAERARLETQIEAAKALAGKARIKLDNPKFREGAPGDVVEKVTAQLAEHEAKVAGLTSQLAEL